MDKAFREDKVKTEKIKKESDVGLSFSQRKICWINYYHVTTVEKGEKLTGKWVIRCNSFQWFMEIHERRRSCRIDVFDINFWCRHANLKQYL